MPVLRALYKSIGERTLTPARALLALNSLVFCNGLIQGELADFVFSCACFSRMISGCYQLHRV